MIRPVSTKSALYTAQHSLLLLRALVIGLLCVLAGCSGGSSFALAPTPTFAETNVPTDPINRREVGFAAADGIMLAGELALPTAQPPRALIVIMHHSGPVDRTSYAYMRDLLLPEGYAVFTFDKRGNGASAGTYGCCEATDALAAYQAATSQPDLQSSPVIIVAQSIGTQYVAEQFTALQAIKPPTAVALLSSLLGPAEITAVATPVIVIVADSEAALERIGPQAVAAHQHAFPYGATLYIAEHAEHTLFDIADGPIDWDDPNWAERYHRGAMSQLIAWIHERTACCMPPPAAATFLPLITKMHERTAPTEH